jgi:murein DD-endopeptidase MepM/ murein hydrolase activator NlpD
MRISSVAVLMIFTTIFLSGCAKDTGTMASIDDRGDNFYSRNGIKSIAGNGGSIASVVGFSNVTAQRAETLSVASNDLPPPVTSPYSQPSPMVPNASWQWPVNGQVTEPFGKQANGQTNQGITIAAAEGTPIKAAQAGEVAFVGQDTKNYGNIAILRHTDGSMSSYAHAREITVTKGARVNAGSVIGTVGQSGNAKTPQLHFAVREGKTSIDPMVKLPHQLASN